jgi:hypothetical protein
MTTIRNVLLTIILITWGGGIAPAFGYVLSSAQILDQYLNTLGRVKTLEARQKLIFFDTRIKEGTAEFDETVRYLFPDRFRSDIKAETTSKTMISSFDKALVLLDGAVAAEHEGGFDYYKDVLLNRNRLILASRLQDLGIDLAETRLDRFEGRIVYVIGKKGEFNEPVPSLSVDKDTLLPLRLVMLTGSSEGERHVLEVLYLAWKKYGKTKFPSRIEFYQDQTLTREVKVETIITDAPFDEALFDVEAIRQDHAARDVRPKEPEVPGEPDGDAKKTIDNLDKIIEKDPLAF